MISAPTLPAPTPTQIQRHVQEIMELNVQVTPNNSFCTGMSIHNLEHVLG